MRIYWVASEATPYAKTGGLADVAAALPKALSELGHHVSVLLPYYPQALKEYCGRLRVCIERMPVPFAWGTEWVQVHEDRVNDHLSYYFLEFNRYFDRPFLYDYYGVEYADNADRFIFFSRAAMEFPAHLGLEPDIIHLHDWHSALCSLYLRSHLYSGRPEFASTRSVLSLHNLGYQGVFDKGVLFMTGLGWEYFNHSCLEYHDRICLLKAGIMAADRVSTVSQTYSREILSPEFAFGMEGSLQHVCGQGRLRGILNGIDVDEWNPGNDPEIPAPFTVDDLSGKVVCKVGLQSELNLDSDAEAPVFGVVSRLAYQKGIDVLVEVVSHLVECHRAQFAILGSGESWLEGRLSELAGRYPGRVGVYIGYNHKLAHMIEAGSDFFVMPSRYEPCGLNQLYSMRYGTVPIVRATGGLADTVISYDPDNLAAVTGFSFNDLYPMALLNTLCWALSVYRDRPGDFRQIIRNGMSQDFSWQHTAGEYEDLYRDAFSSPGS